MTHDAICIPASATVYVQPVDCRMTPGSVAGLDMGAVDALRWDYGPSVQAPQCDAVANWRLH